MTWPFGGLPLGGVFLGQADGPLVELARLGGPLLITAGVWAAGVAVATGASWLAGPRAGRGRALRWSVRPSSRPGSSRSSLAGTVAPDGGGAVRTLRVALVQGGGQRGLSKEQVSPTTVYEAQLAATLRRHRRPPAPGSCSGPRTSWRSTARWPDHRRPRCSSRLAAECAHDARRRGHRAGVGDDLPQRDRRLGPARAHRGRVREGAPGPLRRVRARPLLLLAPRRPLGRADRRRPRARHRAPAHARRAPRAAGLLRDLLRRPQPRLGAGRRGAACRPDQHLLVHHVPGAGAGDGGRGRPGGRDGPRPRPGRTDRLQRGRHRSAVPSWRAARWGGARCSRPPSPSAAA